MNLNRIDDDKIVKDIINKNNEEIMQENERLKGLIDDLTSRLDDLETWKATGLSNNAHYVCDDDATYDAGNSKVLTVVNGIITTIA